MKRTNIYLDEQEHKLLRLIAVENNTTMSALVRLAIKRFLEKPESVISDAKEIKIIESESKQFYSPVYSNPAYNEKGE